MRTLTATQYATIRAYIVPAQWYHKPKNVFKYGSALWAVKPQHREIVRKVLQDKGLQ